VFDAVGARVRDVATTRAHSHTRTHGLLHAWQHNLRELQPLDYEDDWQRNSKDKTALRPMANGAPADPWSGGSSHEFRSLDHVDHDDEFQRNEKSVTSMRPIRSGVEPSTGASVDHHNFR
jgi:hypothetical protein